MVWGAKHQIGSFQGREKVFKGVGMECATLLWYTSAQGSDCTRDFNCTNQDEFLNKREKNV